jgi:hypothetical protein
MAITKLDGLSLMMIIKSAYMGTPLNSKVKIEEPMKASMS